MTKEQKNIIFTNVIEAENKLLTAVREYGNSDYHRHIEKPTAVYYALFQIIKDLDLEEEYSDWKFDGEE